MTFRRRRRYSTRAESSLFKELDPPLGRAPVSVDAVQDPDDEQEREDGDDDPHPDRDEVVDVPVDDAQDPVDERGGADGPEDQEDPENAPEGPGLPDRGFRGFTQRSSPP